jgi:hypothetical protein
MSPLEIGVLVALAGLFFVHALATGRVVVAVNLFYGSVRVRRCDHPVLYWLATLAWGALLGFLLVTLAETLIPGFDVPPLQTTG